jgi:hypothetical protein
MQKISQIALYIVTIISIVLALLFYFGGHEEIGIYSVPNFMNANLAWAGILFIGTVVLTLGFAIEYIVTHPKALKNAVVGLVGGGIILLISYLLASGDPIGGRNMEEISSSTLKWVGTGLIATGILGVVAIIGVIASEIYRAFQ